MKTLLILRHAKSSWKESNEFQDHDRPLNSRGKRDAPRMGQLILKENLVPDYILSSTARRARKTAKAAAQEFHFSGQVEETGKLYHAEADEYLDVLRQLDDSYNRVLVVGHNPGLEDLLELLTGRVEVMPTAALAVVELSINQWSALKGGGKGKLIRIYQPKTLPVEAEIPPETKPAGDQSPTE
jgi:phosphohistidine phosphatase